MVWGRRSGFRVKLRKNVRRIRLDTFPLGLQVSFMVSVFSRSKAGSNSSWDRMLYSVAAMPYTSVQGPTLPSDRYCSGAAKLRFRAKPFSAASRLVAAPKSMSFTVPSSWTIKLLGLMSRWSTPEWCTSTRPSMVGRSSFRSFFTGSAWVWQ